MTMIAGGVRALAALAAPAALAVLAVLAVLLAPAAAHAQVETLGEVRVHGNHTTPDADVLAIAGLTVGVPVTAEALRQAEDRLRRSGRFEGVEVRKRYRSIADPSDVLVVILVDERAAVSAEDLMPGPMRRLRRAAMWLPILDFDDGYGFTFGARVSVVDALGPRSRVSVPLTWGGERRAAVELERQFDRGPFTRVEGAVSIHRRVNPHFEQGDTRREARVRAERALTPWLRAGAFAGVTQVRFAGVDQRHTAPGVDLVVDTRTDPAFPRNAVHAVAAIERLRFDGGARVTRWTADARGYLGLYRSSVFAVRAAVSRAGDPLPPYEQALLGGTATLRGYRAGHRAGDSRLALSGELRVPLTSPLRVGRFGVKAFVDAGTVVPAGSRFADERFDRGVGGGVFMTITALRAGLDVAWPRTGGPRWHFALGANF